MLDKNEYMNANFKLFLLILILFACSSEKKTAETPTPVQQQQESSYWKQQRKGTNYFNKTPTKAWFDAAKDANIQLVRLTYEKWKGAQKDFLLGNADDYKGIVESDFQILKTYLDYAYQLGIKIVLTPITLPGARWIQMNDNKRDLRLWTEASYQQQAIQFWKDLVIRLNNHPAIVGYNIMNEPHPEIAYGKHDFWDKELLDWYESIKGSTGDLNQFYAQVTNSIRSVDSTTPIIIESGLYATPWAFDYLQPIDDEHIIYSFHMYEPYQFTTKRINKGKFSYPSEIYIEGLGNNFQLNKEGLNNFFKPIEDWCKKHQIPSNQIWVGEFGCNRHIAGIEQYLADLVAIFNAHNWHWSFYAFREDTWEGMDYELGTKKVFYKYWEYQEANSLHLHYDAIYRKVADNIFSTIFENEFK
jgi:hypothetical protein